MDHRTLLRLAIEARKRHAMERANSYSWFVKPLAEAGLSYRTIATILEAYRLRTPSGRGRWQPEMVRRIVKRLGLR